MKQQDTPSVLFVCTANRFRSPIAAAHFRALLEKHPLTRQWRVASAGCWTLPGLTVIPSAEWMRVQFGLELEAHRSQPISRQLIEAFRLVIVMESGHQEALASEFPEVAARVAMLTELYDGPRYSIPDPLTQPGESFLGVGREVMALIEMGFPEILARAGE